MTRPLLGQVAYECYSGWFPSPAPPWRELSFSERLAWGKAAHAVVVAAHEVPCARQVEITTEAELWARTRRKMKRHQKVA